MKVRHEVCVWFGVKELILSLKLILDTFSYVWFHVREEFRIISELKQLWVTFVLDQKICTEFYF